jgi:hypothetical protein
VRLKAAATKSLRRKAKEGYFFGNIFGAWSVCIGDCKLREIKSDEQSGGFSHENKLA